MKVFVGDPPVGGLGVCRWVANRIGKKRCDLKNDFRKQERQRLLDAAAERERAEAAAREKADEVFKSEMLRKMAAVEKDLEVETRNRQASEEQLVNALNDYTRALQDGLAIVNRAK